MKISTDEKVWVGNFLVLVPWLTLEWTCVPPEQAGKGYFAPRAEIQVVVKKVVPPC